MHLYLGSTSKMDDCIDIQDPPRPNGLCSTISAFEWTEMRTSTVNAHGGNLQTPPTNPCTAKGSNPATASRSGTAIGRMKLNDIDLNNIYDDTQDCAENMENCGAPLNLGTGSLNHTPRGHQDCLNSSPPQTSGNSGSTSSQSPSTSSGEAQVHFCHNCMY